MELRRTTCSTSSSGPGSPACVRRSSCRRTASATSSSSRRAPTSAAPGATTPTPAPPATSPASCTRSRSRPTPTGRAPTPPSPRSRPTSRRSPSGAGTLDRFVFDTTVESTPRGTTAASGGSSRRGRDRTATHRLRGARCIVGAGGLSEPRLPDIDGHRDLPGRGLPLRAVEPRRRPHRQAGRGDRHRRVGDPDRPGAAEGRRAPRRLPAHRAVGHPAQRPHVQRASSGCCSAGCPALRKALPHRRSTGPARPTCPASPCSRSWPCPAKKMALANIAKGIKDPELRERGDARLRDRLQADPDLQRPTTPPSPPTTSTSSPTRSRRSPATRS